MFDGVLRGLFWSALLFVSYNAFAPPDKVTAPALSDVFLHTLAFTALSGLLFAAYPRWPQWRCVVALLLYGALIEVIQARLPERSPEWKDLAMDGTGIAIGYLCFKTFGRRWLATVRGWWERAAGR